VSLFSYQYSCCVGGDLFREVFGNGIGNWGDMGYEIGGILQDMGNEPYHLEPDVTVARGLIEEGGVIYYEGSGLPSLNVFI